MKIGALITTKNTRSAFLISSVYSLIQQKQIESVYIISDHSDYPEDKTVSLINNDKIKYYKNPNSPGIPFAANFGLSLMAEYDFIVRQDSDDIAVKNRVRNQMRYLKQNPACNVVFGYSRWIGDVSRFNIMPIKSPYVPISLFFGCPLLHSSAVFNNKVFDWRYDEGYLVALDFDLWSRISLEGKIAIIPKLVEKYRVHKDQITNKRLNQQNNAAQRIIREKLKNTVKDISEEELTIHMSILGFTDNLAYLNKKSYKYLEKLILSIKSYSPERISRRYICFYLLKEAIKKIASGKYLFGAKYVWLSLTVGKNPIDIFYFAGLYLYTYILVMIKYVVFWQ